LPHHYTRDTESDTKWCNHCSRHTQHVVSNGRIGRCMEHQVSGESKKQIEARKKRADEAKNPKLFGEN
jgi:hypothetical protein